MNDSNLSIGLSEVDFRSMLESTGLKAGDKVYISSSLAPFFQWENPEEKILKAIRELIGSSGTIFMPAFNFDFCNSGQFDVNQSPSRTGALTEYFRNLPGVLRNWSPPFHSVCIQGPDARDWQEYQSSSSFGSGSLFDNLMKSDGVHISIGCGFHDGVVHVHAVEEKLEVPYRYWKKFSGSIINGAEVNDHSFFMYARNLKINPKIDAREVGEKFYESGYVNRCQKGLLQIEKFKLKDLDSCLTNWLSMDPWLLVANRDEISLYNNREPSPILGVDHIGVLSKYADQIESVLASLGILMSEAGIVPELGVECQYFNLGNTRIELVCEKSPESPLKPYIDKYSSHPIHHIALRVSSLDQALDFIQRNSGLPVLDGQIFDGPRSGERVIFMSPMFSGGVLIELVELPPETKVADKQKSLYQVDHEMELAYG